MLKDRKNVDDFRRRMDTSNDPNYVLWSKTGRICVVWVSPFGSNFIFLLNLGGNNLSV